MKGKNIISLSKIIANSITEMHYLDKPGLEKSIESLLRIFKNDLLNNTSSPLSDSTDDRFEYLKTELFRIESERNELKSSRSKLLGSIANGLNTDPRKLMKIRHDLRDLSNQQIKINEELRALGFKKKKENLKDQNNRKNLFDKVLIDFLNKEIGQKRRIEIYISAGVESDRIYENLNNN